METIIKILGTIALLPFAIAGLIWLFKLIAGFAGFALGGLFLIAIIALLLVYIIWG